MGYWWDRVVLPVRRAWLGVASRFGVRQTGMYGTAAARGGSASAAALVRSLGCAALA